VPGPPASPFPDRTPYPEAEGSRLHSGELRILGTPLLLIEGKAI
jgi:hypothetical protein